MDHNDKVCNHSVESSKNLQGFYSPTQEVWVGHLVYYEKTECLKYLELITLGMPKIIHC